MSPSIAIIGGRGFIGKNFVNFFSDKNYQVKSIDFLPEQSTNVPENVENITADIQKTNEILAAIDSSEVVIWLVHASVPATQDESLVDDFQLNVAPIIRFLEKSSELSNLKKFIYLSSGGTVYGNVAHQIPIKENNAQKPISNYGISKSIAEKYIEYLTQNRKIESIIFRPSNVYGRYQNMIKPQGIIGFAFKSVRDQTTLDLYNEGKVVRDFIHVMDLASVINKSIQSPHKEGTTSFYNAGSKQGFSIKEMTLKIESISESQLQLNHKSSRNFDCEYNVLDIDKAQKDFKWQNEIEIEEGLKDVWEWIKKENK